MTFGTVLNIKYDYDDINNKLLYVYLQGEELTGLLSRHLHFSTIQDNSPFELTSRNIYSIHPLK
jgi:hypothetical protein